MNYNYLTDCIDGKFASFSENRLTKLFCASFNTSNAFKKMFFSFLEYKPKVHASELFAKDQLFHTQENQDNSILDIIIGNLNKYGDIPKPIIIIENKTDSLLKKQQLLKYDGLNIVKSIKNKKCKLALVKNYFESFDVNWNIKHWSEFYYFIKKRKNIPGNLDNFIVHNFLNYLEINQMTIPISISKKDLSDLNDLFRRVGNIKKSPKVSLKNKPVFETAIKYLNMLEGIINKAKEEKDICKRVKRNFQFNSGYGSWYYNGKNDFFPRIYAEIRLKKEYKGIKGLGTSLFFEKKNFSIDMYIADNQGNFIDNEPIKLKNKALYFADYTNQVLKYWKKKLK